MTNVQFGGDWTELKLGIVREYADLYTKALRDTFSQLMYIDAFAGAGTRRGSVQLALQCNPGFNEFVFIDRKRSHCDALERLKDEYPEKSSMISVYHADANEKLREICRETEWRGKRRGLAFLDPYGMQVDLNTLVAISQTQGIDLWLLFPSGIGVNRLLLRSGKIPPNWEAVLDRIFGDWPWRDAFYAPSPQPDLFEGQIFVKEANVATIEREYMDLLRTIFPKVHNRTMRLRNRTNSVMYSLIFCCSNPNPAASGLALNFADYAIRKWND